MLQDVQAKIESLLLAPYWVIDLLPMQVPKDGASRFFSVEPYFLSKPHIETLRTKWSNLLLKLSCYFDLLCCGCEADAVPCHPAPEELVKRIANGEYLAFLLDAEDALIVVDNDSTCIAVYHPTERLLSLLRALAAGEGLFVWQPEG